MGDFTQDDLFEAIDRAVRDLLERGQVTEPPVDALDLLRFQFDYRIEYDAPPEKPQYGDPPKRRARPGELILHPDSSIESQHTVAARAIAKKLIPGILAKLGVVAGTENRGAEAQLVGLVTGRILLPSQWFPRDARRAAFDLLELKERYSNTPWDILAWRMLDADDEPSVVAILDDGTVSARRANRFPVTKKLTPAEEAAVAKVQETDEPAKVRQDEWTAQAWATQGIPFRRIIVRAVPDQL